MRLIALAILVALAACNRSDVAAQSPPDSRRADASAAETRAPSAPRLGFPVACEIGKTCEIQNYVDRAAGPEAIDYRCQSRTYDDHNGVDIRLPNLVAQRAGVAVVAAAAGRISRLRDGVEDVSVQERGKDAVEGQECGNGVVIDHGNGWETQYCHLRRGSIHVKAGQSVAAGEPFAQIGVSGLSEYPHLHFTVRHNGLVVDPFAPSSTDSSCIASAPLWTPAALNQLTYRRGVVLNSGFAPGPVAMDALEAGRLLPVGDDPEALVVYVRAIGLDEGAAQRIVLRAPTGAILAENILPALVRPRAQQLLFVGAKRPSPGWPPGSYRADYDVTVADEVVLQVTFDLRL